MQWLRQIDVEQEKSNRWVAVPKSDSMLTFKPGLVIYHCWALCFCKRERHLNRVTSNANLNPVSVAFTKST